MTAVQRESRFPASVYRSGAEPAPDASLANQRAALAWLQTAVGLVVASVVLAAFGAPKPVLLREIAAGLLVVGALLAAVQGWTGWVAAERAIRRGTPLPSGPALLGLVVVVVLAALLVLVGFFVPA